MRLLLLCLFNRSYITNSKIQKVLVCRLLREHLQNLLLILTEFKRINKLQIIRKLRNRSLLICLNSLNIKNEIYRQSLISNTILTINLNLKGSTKKYFWHPIQKMWRWKERSWISSKTLSIWISVQMPC